MRTCYHCKKTKPASGFHKATASKDGIKSTCKVCCNMLNVLWRLRKKNSKTQLPLSSLGYEFKQFLFFLTFPDNKEKVFRESKNSLSFSEKILLIRMERDNGNEWEEAA